MVIDKMDIILTFILFSILQYGVLACNFGSANDCIFPCRCNGACDQDTGCDGQCQSIPYHSSVQEDGLFHGPTCQIGNIAYGKEAYQSGVYADLVASKAVDGIAYNGHRNCAHPDASSGNAYWAVDLGKKHRIFNVTLYNSQDRYGYRRLDDVAIGVGMTENITEHTRCGFYDGPPVGASDDKHTIQCDAVGRFLSVRRVGGFQPDLFTLCEVVVMGYIYNTNNSDTQCSQWWAPEGMCFIYIRKLILEATTIPRPLNVTSNRIEVSFLPDGNVQTGLEEYYHYNVEYKKSQDSSWTAIAPPITHTAARTNVTVSITNLDHNTQYYVRVAAYREQNYLRELCDIQPRGGVVAVMTLCTYPEQPLIDIDVTFNGFMVQWTVGDSGCNGYTSTILITYGSYSTTAPTSDGQLFVNTAPGIYEVTVTITNTEGFRTISQTLMAEIGREINECSEENRFTYCVFGNCTNYVGGYKCACYHGYHGETCRQELLENEQQLHKNGKGNAATAYQASLAVVALLMLGFVAAFVAVLRMLRNKKIRKEREAEAYYNVPIDNPTANAPQREAEGVDGIKMYYNVPVARSAGGSTTSSLDTKIRDQDGQGTGNGMYATDRQGSTNYEDLKSVGPANKEPNFYEPLDQYQL